MKQILVTLIEMNSISKHHELKFNCHVLGDLHSVFNWYLVCEIGLVHGVSVEVMCSPWSEHSQAGIDVQYHLYTVDLIKCRIMRCPFICSTLDTLDLRWACMVRRWRWWLWLDRQFSDYWHSCDWSLHDSPTQINYNVMPKQISFFRHLLSSTVLVNNLTWWCL